MRRAKCGKKLRLMNGMSTHMLSHAAADMILREFRRQVKVQLELLALEGK